MKIYFTGQKGFPAVNADDLDEKRVEALAKILAAKNHNVIVSSCHSYNGSAFWYGNIELKRRWTVNPEKPGGWLPALVDVLTIWRTKPDAVHIHGWKAAMSSPLISWLVPEAALIFTISALPKTNSLVARYVAKKAEVTFDAITVPNRRLQYELLHYLNLRATYVPDGYKIPKLPNVPVTEWKLRAGQYCLTTADWIEDIRWIARAYAKLKTRKKLVVCNEETPEINRLAKRYRFLQIIVSRPGRAYTSLVRQAAVVIFGTPTAGTESLLQAMDSRRPIIAVSDSLNEETVGTTAVVIKNEDEAALTQALSEVINSNETRSLTVSKTSKRAKNHFTWVRLAKEYAKLYHQPEVIAVPIDSALARPTWHVA